MSTAARHLLSPVPYFLVFAGLLVLTGTTVLVAMAPLGGWHSFVALGIAVLKATLIVLFFMHARESSRLTWMVIIGSILWLAILLGGTLSDYWTRDVDAQIRKQTSQR